MCTKRWTRILAALQAVFLTTQGSHAGTGGPYDEVEILLLVISVLAIISGFLYGIPFLRHAIHRWKHGEPELNHHGSPDDSGTVLHPPTNSA